MSGAPHRKLFAHEIEARLDELLFASPSQRSIGRLADVLEALSRPQQDLVLHWIGVAAKTTAEIGYMIATLAPQALTFLDATDFGDWVLAALDVYDRHGARAALDALRDLDGLRATRASRQVAVFADVEARLTRFIQGLEGRPLALCAGEAAWTDTETIHLPTTLADAGAIADNRRLYKVLAVLLWAQTRHGTFTHDLDTALATWPDRARALHWLAVFEAARLEACVAAELPGLARDIAAARGAWPDELAGDVAVLSRPGTTVADSLQCMARRMVAGEVPPALPQIGMLDPTAAARVRAARIARDTATVRRAIAAIKGAAGQGGATDDAYPLLAANGGEAQAPVPIDIATLPPDARAAAQSLLQDLGTLPPECLTPAGAGAWTPTAHVGDGPAMTNERAADRFHDEWDYHRQAYRRDWCHVFESAVVPGDAAYVDAVRQRHAPLIRQIRRRFEILRGEDRIQKRQPDGEDIDVDALVEAVGDRRGGAEPSPRVFCRRQRSERSLAVMFMVDMSGSTKGWINDAEREALVMLAEAIETLGDRWAVYGFSGWTRTRCDLYRVKDFHDAYDDAVRDRIAGIEAKDYTRMGVAIRHLSGLLARQPTRHKLLVTLSDGRPDDFGDEYRGRYGIEDTRRALAEARAQGIRGYCVTIDRHGADYLPHMYGSAAYVVLDDVKKLPLKIAEIYRKLAT